MTYIGSNDELEVKPEKQTGFIKICSKRGVQYVYKVDVPDMRRPSIKFGDEIDVSVNGPTCCSLDYKLYMQHDLFCGAYSYKGRKCLGWRVFDDDDEAFSAQVRLESGDGTGEIVVNLGCFSNATVAKLEVMLLDNSAATKVYGVVAANNSILDTPNCTSLLFVKKPENAIEVGDKGVIPLYKSGVGVPLNSVLHVDISLNLDGHDYTASLDFDAQKEGESIIDANDMIKVKVSWCADEAKLCSMYDENHDDRMRPSR